MNKKQLILLCMLAAGGSIQAQQWPDAPAEARPGTRWWWLGSAVDEKNLTYNLEEYARAGMGAVEITPIYGVQGNDANDIQFLSPRWMEVLKHTQAEGKRTGIEIDMNTGTGWPFGGPEVSIEDAASKAIFQTYDIEGGQEIGQEAATLFCLKPCNGIRRKRTLYQPYIPRQERQTGMESPCRKMESDSAV